MIELLLFTVKTHFLMTYFTGKVDFIESLTKLNANYFWESFKWNHHRMLIYIFI